MDGEITIGTRLDTKNFDKQIEDLERKLEQMEKSYETGKKLGFKEDEEDLKKLEVEIEKTRNKIVSLNQQKEKLGKTSPIDNLGKSFQKSLKNVARLTLGIFGIRSAYLAVRRASSDLSGYDEQYATNLEYIRFVLTQAIAPVLRGIVQLAMTLLQFINMIVNALFGVNLFSKGSAEAFNKMKNKAGGVSKAVKDIKKQLAGFDEINVLTDQSDTGTSAGAGGVGPSMDLSSLQGEVPEWMKWIVDNAEFILGIIAGVVAGIIAIKYGLTAIQGLGIVLMITGVINAIKDMIAFLKDPTWEKFGALLKDFGLIIVGLGLLIGNWVVVAIGAVTLLVGAIIEHWEDIKKVFAKIGQWLYDNIGKPVKEMFENMVTSLGGLFSEFYQVILWIGQNVYNSIVSTWTGITGFFNSLFIKIKGALVNFGTKAGQVVGNSFKTVINGVLKAIETILNTPIKAINGLIGTINKVPGINITRLNTFSLPRLAVGGIVNMPNRGTMIGGAVAGESGAEGVIPLTDRQAMETLGEAIGRYITINANIINRMNGRTISRELVQVQNDQSFAYNS